MWCWCPLREPQVTHLQLQQVHKNDKQQPGVLIPNGKYQLNGSECSTFDGKARSQIWSSLFGFMLPFGAINHLIEVLFLVWKSYVLHRSNQDNFRNLIRRIICVPLYLDLKYYLNKPSFFFSGREGSDCRIEHPWRSVLHQSGQLFKNILSSLPSTCTWQAKGLQSLCPSCVHAHAEIIYKQVSLFV